MNRLLNTTYYPLRKGSVSMRLSKYDVCQNYTCYSQNQQKRHKLHPAALHCTILQHSEELIFSVFMGNIF